MSEELVELAQAAARRGGEVLKSWAPRFSVSEKSPANLVTEADLASQTAIHEMIEQRFPDHAVLGEEDLLRETDSAFRWIIDPLDGTSNYVHRFPYFAVSIAVERDGELQAAAIYDPSRDEMFWARRGGGAFLNSTRLRTTSVDELGEAMTVASLPIRAAADDPAIQRFVKVMQYAQTVQRTGSAALNLAYVASGRIDAFWSSSLKPWDMAAGVLLVREAGGRVTRMDGGNFQVDQPNLLASNGRRMHDELQRLLSDC